MPARVDSIQYDPNRTARIALLHYVDGEKRYILAPEGLKAGDKVQSGETAAGGGGQLPAAGEDSAWAWTFTTSRCCRAAAACCAARPGRGRRWPPATPIGPRSTCPAAKFAACRPTCRATIGSLGNADHMGIVLGKAGRKRWMGRRPHVRGTAMNPIDHPHGGGEGRTKGGRHPVSPTGKLAKGGFTRKRRKPSSKAIVRRRSRGGMGS